ncbi:MAG: DUF1049 domain-containing protein [Bacteroidetes bacterium]|nr:MAG: DUF1049 domain-containing protein [Bacteroidota bacterium]
MDEKKKPLIFWIIAGLIIVVSILLAVMNWTETTINFIFFEVRGRLIFILAIFFFLGFFLGKLTSFFSNRKKKKKEEEEAKVTYIESGKE